MVIVVIVNEGVIITSAKVTNCSFPWLLCRVLG